MTAERIGTAFVTGAGGFIGRALAVELERRGWGVTGVDVHAGEHAVAGDITRDGPWLDVLAGADVVVHTAAVVDDRIPYETQWQVNVEGTRRVLEAAAERGVGRVVHLSSKVVHGTGFTDGIDETAPVRMTGSAYTDTKVASEHLALQMAASGRVPVTVVRPGDVYGPGSVPWVLRALELLRLRVVLPMSGRGVLSPVYVDDLVAGVIAAATHPDGAGRVFNVNGGVGVTTKDYFGRLAAMIGVRVHTVPVPGALASALLQPVALLARATGRDVPISPAAVEYLCHPGTYSIAAARDVLGWRPQVDLEEGMRRTQAWLEAEQLL